MFLVACSSLMALVEEDDAFSVCFLTSLEKGATPWPLGLWTLPCRGGRDGKYDEVERLELISKVLC
jgi:hypothetical protein